MERKEERARVPPSAYLDMHLLRRLWSALPANRCDRSFWNGLEAVCEPFLDENCPLRSHEYFTVPHTGRIAQSDLHFIDESIVAQGNEKRMLYDAFTLWNPFALAALLKTPIAIVVEQLLLAVEYKFMSMRFVVSCGSCAFDIKHFSSVSDVPFSGTYYTRNSFRCPMCTDRTDVTSLSSVNVFFQFHKLHPIFQRPHHRLFVTETAEKQRLETFFCPSGAGFAVPLYLPRGEYLLCAPFMASVVELDVQVGADVLGDKDPFFPRVIDIKNYCVEPAGNRAEAKLKMGGGRHASGSVTAIAAGASVVVGGQQGGLRGRAAAGGVGHPERRSVATSEGRRRNSQRTARRSTIRNSAFTLTSSGVLCGASAHNGGGDGDGASHHHHHAGQRESTPESEEGEGDAANGFGAHEVEEIAPTQVLALRHGKVQLRVYNSTEYSGFMDLYVKFDRRAEFAAVTYPKQFTLPDLLHCIPRGLRSRHLVCCTPLPPSQTPTAGVFVRHYFDLDAGDFVDAEVLAIVREVHRYSLEDQHGLLLSVSNGGTAFESTFLSVTAALASSMCFFQRVLVRLDESVAMALRTSITEGPLLLAAYQGQYNDAENMRSAYPDVQIIGPAVYASNHPPIRAPRLFATMIEAPSPPMTQQRVRGSAAAPAEMGEFHAALREEAFDLATATAAAKEAAARGVSTEGRLFAPWLGAQEDSDDNHGLHPAVRNGSGDGVAEGEGRSAASVGSLPRHSPRHRQSGATLSGSAYHKARGSVAPFTGQSVLNHSETMARFELRSVRRSLANGGISLADVRGGSIPLKADYAVSKRRERARAVVGTADGDPARDPFDFGEPDASEADVCPSSSPDGDMGNDDDDDVVLPYFLKYLEEQLEGTKLEEEPHALVLMVPMVAMYAAVQLPNMLDRSAYIKAYLGPF